MNENFKFSALICCRGGSKGIPGKNIKLFSGKPLLGWILEAAIQSKVFDEVILSTDSDKIAQVGEQYGAFVPGLRPSNLAQDNSDQFDTHKYVFNQLGIKDETHRVCILNNNPFINSELILEGFDAFKKGNFDKIVLDTVMVEGDYIYYRQCYEQDGTLRFMFPKLMLESQINRQTISPTYTTMNNMRWGKPSFVESYEAYKIEIITNGIVPISLPKLRNIDIDDTNDWKLAEIIFNNL